MKLNLHSCIAAGFLVFSCTAWGEPKASEKSFVLQMVAQSNPHIACPVGPAPHLNIPKPLRDRGGEWVIRVEVRVGVTGETSYQLLVASGDTALDESILKKLATWKWEAATDRKQS